MARIRTVKPEFWTSEQVMELSPLARLAFIGMWNFCDDAGVHTASAKRLKWRKADRRTLKRDFGPAAVRKILDDDAGLGKSQREAIYIKFSTLAGHPTLDGFAMLRPKGMTAHIGPFSDLTALRAVLEEMGMLAPQAGFAFCVSLDTSIVACSQVAHHFLTGAMDYSGKYLGKPYSDEERVEVDQLFARLS
jgi:hypothetical protein